MSEINTPDLFAKCVTEYLSEVLSSRIKEASLLDPSYSRLWKSIEQVVFAGGKRMRPKIIFLSYQALGGKDFDSIIKIAAAHELLHVAVLIHDDIIDRDDFRHGQKNINGLYSDYYQSADSKDVQHYSHSAALLAGDLLISESYKQIYASNLPEAIINKTSDLLHKGIFEVVSGELLDTESAFIERDDSTALKICSQKTASYSLIMPLLTGAVLANAPKETQQILREFGEAMGVSFQLVDDLLGVFGDESLTGKSNSSDLIEGKMTYLVEQFMELASQKQKTIFSQYFGNNMASNVDISKLKKLLIESGAKEKIEQLVEFKSQHAKISLEKLPYSKNNLQGLYSLIDKITDRNY